jgi:virulence factor Mce-like protein
MTHTPNPSGRQIVNGSLFIGLVMLIVAGTVAKYRGAFEHNALITVESSRAGLTLAKGAPIKLRGVQIGDVGMIHFDGKTVRIDLEIDQDEIDRVPADATAQIVPPTAFGAKYVQLTAPPGSTAAPIQAGAVIPATRVTVEVDEAFQNLTEVLDAAQPAQVNAALTAVAGAVDQRGELIGDLISQTDRYLVSLNPALPRLTSDLRAAADVLDVYEAARPDLVDTLAQTGKISDTAVRQQASLRALERSLTTFGDNADVLLRSSEHGIVTSLNLLAPVTRTLQRYSPELPCVVLGLVAVNGPMEAAIGGTNPGLTTTTRLIPRRDPYTYGLNLPLIGDDRGPACYGLPEITPAEAAQPPPWLKTGANPYVGPQPKPSQAALGTLLGFLQGGILP